MKVWDFMTEFTEALIIQLREDDERWGNTWLERSRDGQEERTIKTINEKFLAFAHAGQEINWLQIAGSAMICWIRENHPEIWKS